MDLAAADAACAFQAMQALNSAPLAAVAFLRDRVRPLTMPDAAGIEQLIAELDSDTFVVRERATRELERLHDVVRPALQQALRHRPSLELRRRAERLLEMKQTGDSPERLRLLRAVELLEWLNTSEARRLLRELAHGAPNAWLTREAKAALARLPCIPW